MSHGTWISGDPANTPTFHACEPPDIKDARLYATVWQCSCGTQWEPTYSERRRPRKAWKQVSWFFRRKQPKGDG